jgi:hypothetical protein
MNNLQALNKLTQAPIDRRLIKNKGAEEKAVEVYVKEGHTLQRVECIACCWG